jgi:hypothetical protein
MYEDEAIRIRLNQYGYLLSDFQHALGDLLNGLWFERCAAFPKGNNLSLILEPIRRASSALPVAALASVPAGAWQCPKRLLADIHPPSADIRFAPESEFACTYYNRSQPHPLGVRSQHDPNASRAGQGRWSRRASTPIRRAGGLVRVTCIAVQPDGVRSASSIEGLEVTMAKGQKRSNREKKKPKQDKNKKKGADPPSPFAGMHSQVKLGTSYTSQYGKKH